MLTAQEKYKQDQKDVQERIETILREAGVKLKLGGCGCCGSPWVEAEFPDGKNIDVDHIRIDTFDQDEE
jgi:hypothetical protein